MFAELAGALAGGALGSMLGGGGSKKQDLYFTPQFVNTMNDLLQKSMNSAISQSTDYTNKGVESLNKAYSQNRTDLQSYLANALQQAQSHSNKGLLGYQATQGPYAKAGYDALDAYKRSLGLPTMVGGSSGQVQNSLQAQSLAQQLKPLLSSLNGNYNAPVNNAVAPNAENIMKSITDQQIRNYINSNMVKVNHAPQGSEAYQYTGVSDGSITNNPWRIGGGGGIYSASPTANIAATNLSNFVLGKAPLVNSIRSLLAQPEIQKANQAYGDMTQQYNTNLNNFNAANKLINSIDPKNLNTIAFSLKGLL